MLELVDAQRKGRQFDSVGTADEYRLKQCLRSLDWKVEGVQQPSLEIKPKRMKDPTMVFYTGGGLGRTL